MIQQAQGLLHTGGDKACLVCFMLTWHFQNSYTLKMKRDWATANNLDNNQL